MRIISMVLLVSLFCPTLFFGQGETSNWFFGNGAGITFNSDGSITPTTQGRLDTFEGCATISDSFGDLLFYTDGIIVYDRDHKVMQNGGNLLGDPSSTQSALIVPKPGDPNIFFIFTVDTSSFQGDPDRGLNYSIVDVTLNDGKGAVTQKNIPLLNDCSEKVAAVIKDCSDQSIWLLTFASLGGSKGVFDTFHAFEINTNGVNVTSVKTTFEGLDIEDPRGYLKISPDGNKLANANVKDGLYLYDFDAATGKLSNQESVFISGSNKAAYGVEFSPNSQYLYIHASNDIFAESGHRSSLLQYDLASSDISQSQEIIDTRSIYRGALQLGDNGKIYRTAAKNYFQGTPFLSVINNPNQKGDAVNYEHEAIALNGKNATQGLPPFIQSFFNKIALIKKPDGTTTSSLSICAGEPFTLEAELIPGAIYIWEKDGESLAISGNTLQIPSSANTDSGKYRLTIQTANPSDCPIIGEALIRVAPLPETSLLSLQQCDVDENIQDGFTIFDLEQAGSNQNFDFTFYETRQDQTNGNPIANPDAYSNTKAFTQTLFYSVTNELGCSDTGEITLIVNPTEVITSDLSPIVICDTSSEDTALVGSVDLDLLRQEQFSGLDVAFYENLTDAALEDNELEGSFSTSNLVLYVRTENDNQCQSIETIDFVVKPLPEITLEDSYQVCSDGEALVINAPANFDSYKWYKKANDQFSEIGSLPQISITNGGTYSLEVAIKHENNGRLVTTCTSSIDFTVVQSNRATFTEINIEDFSNNNTIMALVTGDGEYEFSLDSNLYQDSSFFENIEPGFYTVFARDKKGCGISEKDIAVVGFPKFFTPNGDGSNDTWQLTGSGKDMVTGNITIHDRYGRLIKQLDTNSNGWDGSFLGEMLPASDYWFRITLVDGRDFKGHFALKR
ncbi:T9SS type B sorting domain-containing protein [Maribacter algarum]|uniref:T9SS type B sorting domain-containing protein n=2 Tax=Maribacter algarum (ex Zhang et al. 2020) TaxID=2578118 RepID=A0A5S3Q978_9FLAO|nr:T9SS type B sorting domain-containing protein [Maribacter algarum]